MRSITIQVGEEDLKDLEKIFENESSFKPQVREDFLIVAILKQVLKNSQNESNSSH